MTSFSHMSQRANGQRLTGNSVPSSRSERSEQIRNEGGRIGDPPPSHISTEAIYRNDYG